MITYTNTDLFSGMQECPYCSDHYNKIWHNGVCPKIKSIEYYSDGTVKKVEFVEEKKKNLRYDCKTGMFYEII